MAEYIEREALLGSIGLTQLHFVAHGDNKSLYDIINEQSAADVAPVVHGRWVKGENWSVTCSVCGCLAIAHDGKNYCPYCGAKMDAEVDDNG